LAYHQAIREGRVDQDLSGLAVREDAVSVVNPGPVLHPPVIEQRIYWGQGRLNGVIDDDDLFVLLADLRLFRRRGWRRLFLHSTRCVSLPPRFFDLVGRVFIGIDNAVTI